LSASWSRLLSLRFGRRSVAEALPEHTGSRQCKERAKVGGASYPESCCRSSSHETGAYYAGQLDDLGWSEPFGGWLRPIEGDPFRIWVQADVADLEAHPDWEDLHFGVTVTVLAPERVKVDVAVRRHIVTVF
jgi:hypothetical protein